ncbi:MAG: guanylate kinase [Acidimicrobiales bacterium]|nr:guanylate kinase [Acidimicrobiales bacterium]
MHNQNPGESSQFAFNDDLGKHLVVVISGPGGVGKGTVVRALLDSERDLWLSKSWTTRARREGEAADAYTFVDEATFMDHADKGGFLEWAEFLDHHYGTPWPNPRDGQVVILEIDVQGAQQVLRALPNSARMVFLMPPSKEVQKERLEHRGDASDHVVKRLLEASREEEIGLGLAHAVIVNDDLEKAVGEVAGKIMEWKSKLVSK